MVGRSNLTLSVASEPDGLLVLPPLEGDAMDRMSFFMPRLKPGSGPVADSFERTELAAWRLFGADVMPFLEAALADQGEAPDGKLLSLQHALAELLRSSTHSHQEQPNTK